MVLERGRPAALHPRRRVERAGVDVRRTSTPGRPGIGPPENGFRCVRDDASDGAGARGTGRRQPPYATPSKETPASDEVFQLIREPLRLRPDRARRARGGRRTLETPYWRRETVSFASAGLRTSGSRRTSTSRGSATPPYQAVVYANPGMALQAPVARARRGADLRLRRQERTGVPAPGAEGLLPAALPGAARRTQRVARSPDGWSRRTSAGASTTWRAARTWTATGSASSAQPRRRPSCRSSRSGERSAEGCGALQRRADAEAADAPEADPFNFLPASRSPR